jgi:hypothetical protein
MDFVYHWKARELLNWGEALGVPLEGPGLGITEEGLGVPLAGLGVAELGLGLGVTG